MKDTKLEDLWEAPAQPGAPFSEQDVAGLPGTAQRYLRHAIALGTPRASIVRLQMHGSIRLAGSWHPFEAEQVIRWDRGFVWHAKARMHGLPVTGYDRWIDGEGEARWKLLGIIPVMSASGKDTSRAAAERMQIESMWVPAVLLHKDVRWSEHDSAHIAVDMSVRDQHAHCELSLAETGQPRWTSMQRWSNLAGTPFRPLPFGGLVEAERTFDGYTIPSTLRVGWYFGTNRFESEGEFFRCTVDRARYR